MTLIKKLTVNFKEYTVTLKRFDDVVDPRYGAEYHGYYITSRVRMQLVQPEDITTKTL